MFNICYGLKENISSNIPLNLKEVLDALSEHQGNPWNGDLGNNYNGANIINDLYEYINSGIPKEDF